jgi:hypothetical protein
MSASVHQSIISIELKSEFKFITDEISREKAKKRNKCPYLLRNQMSNSNLINVKQQKSMYNQNNKIQQ